MVRELDAARRAALEAGKILMRYYGRVDAQQKKDGSVVTKADRESESLIKSMLMKEFPGYSFLGEEGGLDDRGSEFMWVVDPLDGTSNYIIRNPFFNVSIGLMRGGEPVAGVVYSPFQKEMFSASKGRGTYLNGKRVRVSGTGSISSSVISFCHERGKENTDNISRIFHEIKLLNKYFRQYGASALELAYVACGRLDAYINVGQKPWDVAAGILLVREAGGKVTEFSGKELVLGSNDMLASNGKVHGELMKTITASLKK